MQHIVKVFAKIVELFGIELGGKIDEAHPGLLRHLTYHRIALGNVIVQMSLQLQRIRDIAGERENRFSGPADKLRR